MERKIEEMPPNFHRVANTAYIRCRAYALYEERGREDGHDLDDWLRAEAELIEAAGKVAAKAAA